MNNEYTKDRSYIKQRLEYVTPVDYIIELENKIDEKDKEIEQLTKECIGMKDEIKDLCNKLSKSNNIIDELKKWLKDEANFWKQQQEEAIKNGWLEFGGKYNTTIIYENAINKLKELEEGKE